MSEEGASQPQRYCKNCGIEVRPGDTFCASCGASVASNEGESLRQKRSPSTAQTSSMNDVVKEKLRGVVKWFRGSSASPENAPKNASQNPLQRFKDLPTIPKAAIVVVGAVLLLTVLSPLGLVAAMLLFGVSLIGLIVRLAQRKSVQGWGIVAITSLVLAFVFVGTANALYSEYLLGSATTDIGDVADSENATDKEDPKGKGDAKNPSKSDKTTEKGPESAEIDPKLQKIVNDWRSSGTESPLFLPTYLPFPIAEAGPDPNLKGYYYIYSSSRNRVAPHIRLVLVGPAVPASSLLNLDEITIDGRRYTYSDDPSFDYTGHKREPGEYGVMLWVKSERGKEYMYAVEMNTMSAPLPAAEFAKMVRSLKRIDPPERTSPAEKD